MDRLKNNSFIFLHVYFEVDISLYDKQHSNNVNRVIYLHFMLEWKYLQCNMIFWLERQINRRTERTDVLMSVCVLLKAQNKSSETLYSSILRAKFDSNKQMKKYMYFSNALTFCIFLCP